MCSLHNRFKIISASLVFSLLLTSCNSQFTQSPQNQVPVAASSTTTANSEEVNSNLGPNQSADLSSIANLFPTSGMVQSDHFSLHVSQKALDKLGIPNGYTVDPTDLEEMYKFSLAYWAYSLFQWGENSSLSQFKNFPYDDSNPNNKDLPLAVYDQNAAMGTQGFNYYFDFGQAYNDTAYVNACKNVNIAGVVKSINVYVTNDFDNVFLTLYQNNVCFVNRGTILVLLGNNGQLIVINGLDLPADEKNPAGILVSSQFDAISQTGMLIVEATNPNHGSSLNNFKAISDYFHCSDNNGCKDPGSKSDFKY